MSEIQRGHVKRTLHHILQSVKGGDPHLPQNIFKSYIRKKCQKVQDALHPDALLSTLQPEETIIAP
eukprot:2511444-Ditylum_brightwellii.AAC.1